MRRTVLLGIALLSVAAFSFLTVTPVERKVLNPDGATPLAAAAKPTQVEVTNFPAIQTVSGTVNVGNLPAVQSVSGTVSVGNLPLDGSGHVLVAVQNTGSGALALHSTAATYQGDLGGRTGATQKCRAEYAGSHFANRAEIESALGLGPFMTTGNARGVIWLTSETDLSWVDGFPRSADENGRVNCGDWLLSGGGNGTVPRYSALAVRPQGTDLFNGDYCDQAHSILCAE
jgi:hypothetical protein